MYKIFTICNSPVKDFTPAGQRRPVLMMLHPGACNSAAGLLFSARPTLRCLMLSVARCFQFLPVARDMAEMLSGS